MRILQITGRIVRQLLHDRRTLGLLFIVPLFLLFVFQTVLNSSIGKPKIEAVNLPAALRDSLAGNAAVTDAAADDAALRDLRARKTDAVVEGSGTRFTVHIDGGDNTVTAAVKKAVSASMADYTRAHAEAELRAAVEKQQKALQAEIAKATAAQREAAAKAAEKQATTAQQALQKEQAVQGTASLTLPKAPALRISAPAVSIAPVDVDYAYLHGSGDYSTFDSVAAMITGFFIFLFVFLTAGVAFLRERTTGTLERLLSTPVRRFEIVAGYFVGFEIFALAQTALIQAYLVLVLRAPLQGSFPLVLLINVLLATCSLSLGTLLSAFARNELQLFQFIPVVVVPQVLFCGLFNLRGAPLWVVLLSKLFPMTYGADALTAVALRGEGAAAVGPDLLVLAGFTALFLALNTYALRQYRRF